MPMLSAATPAWLAGTPGPYRSTSDGGDAGGAASGDGGPASRGGWRGGSDVTGSCGTAPACDWSGIMTVAG